MMSDDKACVLFFVLFSYHDGHDRLLVMEKEHLKVSMNMHGLGVRCMYVQ